MGKGIKISKISTAKVVVSGKYGLAKEKTERKISVKINLNLKTRRGFFFFYLKNQPEGK